MSMTLVMTKETKSNFVALTVKTSTGTKVVTENTLEEAESSDSDEDTA